MDRISSISIGSLRKHNRESDWVRNHRFIRKGRQVGLAVKLLMPKLGLNMVEGQVTEWLRKEGDLVKKGDAIYIVETDKVTNEVEAPQDGKLIKILVKAGDVVPG